MLKKDQILKIFKKYGFYSLNRAPYLYQNHDSFGVYFVWPTKNFGNLERVLFFESEMDLEEEIFKYWWFMNNKSKANIYVEFNDYETLSPQVFYKHRNKVLNSESMKNFWKSDENLIDDKSFIMKKNLLRTGHILILILKEKFRLQNETYFKVLELQESLKQLTTKYQKKLKEYTKSKEEIKESYELLMDEYDESEQLANNLYNDLCSLDDMELIGDFVDTLLSYLEKIDTSNTHLQNVYLLNRYPYEIEDINKKIVIVDSFLHQKKKLFKSKDNIFNLLKDVDDKSAIKKMINVNLYIEKEKAHIVEKYKNCHQMDKQVLGDYLLNFENIHVDIPKINVKNDTTILLEPNEVIDLLKKFYEKLTDKEKSACHVAGSFLSQNLNELLEFDNLSIKEVVKELINTEKIENFNESYKILDYYLNSKIRVKYLSILKMNSFESFLESLLEVIKILKQLNITFDSNFIGYYTNKSKKIIPLYLKNLSYLNNKEFYIVSIMKKVPIYYSPVEIVKSLDIIENDELVVREKDFIFLLNNKIKIEESKNVISVKHFEQEKVLKKNDLIVIMNMKETKQSIYYQDVVSLKEGELIL